MWYCASECFYSYTVGGNAGSLKSKFENLARAEEEVIYLSVSTTLLILIVKHTFGKCLCLHVHVSIENTHIYTCVPPV